MSEHQGSQANRNGRHLENVIVPILKSAGYKEIESETKIFFEMDKWYIKQYIVGKTLYGTSHKIDYYLYNKLKYPNKLLIEAKWQADGGSVDEKYPYLVMTLKQYSAQSIIVIDGGGYKPLALVWLKNQIDTKLIGVFSISEFMNWVNNGGL